MSTTTTLLLAQPPQQQDASQLKNLQFIESSAKYMGVLAYQMYTAGKERIPNSLKSTVAAAEDKVVQFGSPLATTMQDSAAKYLTVADEQVDAFLGKVKSSQLTTYVNKYADVVKVALEKVKAAQIKGQESAIESVQAALDKAKGVKQFAADSAQKFVSQISVAWEQLMQNDRVAKAVEQMQPAIEAAKQRYLKIHDIVVSNQAYSRVWHTTVDMATHLQQTTLARTATSTVYPYVAPLVDPILASDYVTLALNHTRPKDLTSSSPAAVPTSKVPTAPMTPPALIAKY